MNIKKNLKKIILAVIVVATPVVGAAVSAPSSPIRASALWEYGDYNVEKLDFGKVADGPFSLGGYTYVSQISDSCGPIDCGKRDIFVLNGGEKSLMSNIPKEVLTEKAYFQNENRMVWADSKNNYRYDIVELDLKTGIRTILEEDVFINGAETMSVHTAGNIIYLNPVLNFTGKDGFKQSAVYRYNPETDTADIVTKHNDLQREDIVDTRTTGELLTKMTFATGEKQLWIYDGKGGYGVAVPESWTPAHEDIVGAQFKWGDDVEFFSMYKRHYFDGVKTTVYNEYPLNFNEPIDKSLIIFGYGSDMNTYWLDQESKWHKSNTIGEITIIARPPVLSINAYTIYIPSYSGVNVKNGEILYIRDAHESDTLKIGYGSDAKMTDNRHIYWRGVDGGIYEGTISLKYATKGIQLASDTLPVGSKVKLDTDSKVYLIGTDGKLHWVASELVAHSVFGAGWNREIIELNMQEFSKYGIGSIVNGEADTLMI